MAAVLLVTPDDSVSQIASRALFRAGHDLVHAENAQDGMHALMTVKAGAVVLDGSLEAPELETIAEWIRMKSPEETGLVFLISARARPASVPIDPDVDQLLVKPFSPDQLRQAVDAAVSQGSEPAGDTLFVGEFELVRPSHQVRKNDEAVDLTQREFQLLEYLAINRGRFVSAKELLREVWHREEKGESDSVVRQHIQNVRSKLKALAAGAELIQTYPRRGYMLQ